MISSQSMLKHNVFEHLIFPQLPNFCGIAACCTALSCILQRQLTEQELHTQYEVGRYTKLRIPVDHPLDNLKSIPRLGQGFSNWDVVRLINAVLLDYEKEPSSVILCGEDFVREVLNPHRLNSILDWLQDNSSHAIVHIMNHYAVFGGVLQSPKTREIYLLLADSSVQTGPFRSIALSEIINLALRDQRYGVVLVSDKPIPQNIFELWTAAMTPPEVSERKRFARINAKR